MKSVFICHRDNDKADLTLVLSELIRLDVPILIDNPLAIDWPDDVREKALNSKEHVDKIQYGTWDVELRNILADPNRVACFVALYTESFRDSVGSSTDTSSVCWREIEFYTKKSRNDGRWAPLVLQALPIEGSVAPNTLRSAADYSIRKVSPDFFKETDWAEILAGQIRNYYVEAVGSGANADGITVLETTTLSLAAQNLKQQLLNGKTPEGQLLDDVYKEPPKCIESYRLNRYSAWARDCNSLEKRFVNLRLLEDRGVDSQQERVQPTEHTYNDLQKLLDEKPNESALLLMGEPGCGKSTVLQHYEMTQAQSAIVENASNELCIWQRLSEYSIDSAPPEKWLEQCWAENYPKLPSLAKLQQQYPLRYILDGLNEITHRSDADYTQVVHRWAVWAAKLKRGGSAAAPLFSIRSQNYSALFSTEEFSPLFVKFERWSPAQIKAFAEKQEVAELWPHIEHDKKLLKFSGLPINLAQQCELFQGLQRPARNRAELFGGLLWLRIVRARKKWAGDSPELDAEGLLDEEDKIDLDNPGLWCEFRENPENLLHPPEGGLLLKVLDEQAALMHNEGAEVSVSRKTVAKGLEKPVRKAWFDAVVQLNLVDLSSVKSLRFAHQSWQEYFAARGLSKKQWLHASSSLTKLPDFSAPTLEPLDDVLGKLSVGDLLPGPGVSHWEEAAKILLPLLNHAERKGASEDLASWFNEMIRQNPAMAARAAVPMLDSLPGDSLNQLREKLLSTSRDANADLRVRIEAGEALGEMGDPRYESGASPEGVHYIVPTEKHMVRIDAGSYPVGGNDADAEDDECMAEGGVARVQLDAFEMAFAPVTNAEYECFVDARGYDDEQWWEGDAAKTWREGDNEITERVDYFRELFAELRSADDIEAVARRKWTNPTESNFDTYRRYANWSESEAEDILQKNYGAKKHTEPSEWSNRSFNRPNQPVVGISWYEAQAYCRWLSAVSGQRWLLPTEAQWQAAAAGIEGRRWPWGREPNGKGIPDVAYINTHDTHLRKTSPVGVFPAADTRVMGDNAIGLADMAGNVYEWCSSDYSNPLNLVLAVGESLGGDARVLRGGSFWAPAVNARCAWRHKDIPVIRTEFIGFRIAREINECQCK